jgi:glutaredoxin
MTLIRWFLGKLILLLDALTAPQPPAVVIDAPELVLYQFEACPFCVKVRRAMRRLGVRIEIRDAKLPEHEKALVEGGGELQVPCLRIFEIPQEGRKSESPSRWLYESDAIVSFLEQYVASRSPVSQGSVVGQQPKEQRG